MLSKNGALLARFVNIDTGSIWASYREATRFAILSKVKVFKAPMFSW